VFSGRYLNLWQNGAHCVGFNENSSAGVENALGGSFMSVDPVLTECNTGASFNWYCICKFLLVAPSKHPLEVLGFMQSLCQKSTVAQFEAIFHV
jgi:hypothetical protein